MTRRTKHSPAPAEEHGAEEQKTMKARTASLEMELAHKNFLLQQGFEKFIDAAEKLQESHHRLQQKIAELDLELEEKNRELEQNLQEREKVKTYLSNIFESLAIGVLVTDLEGHITSVNRTGQEMLGTEGARTVGAHVNELLGHELVIARKGWGQLTEAALQAEEPITFQRGAGETLKLQLTPSLMRSEQGEPLGFIFNVQDVTLLKKLEEDAARRNRFTAMGEMAANIAHEIRNPLGSIELFTSLVQKSLDAEDEKGVLMNHISSNVASMNHIISNLLAYTKPRPLSRQRLHLHELLRSAAEMSHFMAEQHQVEVKHRFESGRSLILGDEEQLKQVFNNLFLNAVQSMPEGGELTLRTREVDITEPRLLSRFHLQGHEAAAVDGFIEVMIRDTGVGIPGEAQKRIFDPFFTTKARGTGLGLSIVHNIIEAHHATIDVDSRVSEGTAFVMMFPLVKE